MKKRNDFRMLAVLLLNTIVAATVFLDNPIYGREYIILAFLLLGPGLSLGFLLSLEDRISWIFLIIVLSVAVDTVITEAILYLGLWSPELILMILVLFCLLMLVFEIFAKSRYATSSVTP